MVLAELVGFGQRDGGASSSGLYSGGEDPLRLRVQAGDEAATFARPDGTGEIGPGPVAHIQVAEEWAQVTATPTA